MIGQTIRQYQFLEILGQGSLGLAYKVQDSELNRFVVIKFLPSAFITDQLRSRGKAIAGLQHPHIAKVFSDEEIDGKRFIVVEYLPGGSLKSQITALRTVGQKLSLELIIHYARQVGEALAYAHHYGIVHGNLKTENLMLAEDANIKITDFGLVKPCTTRGVEETICVAEERTKDAENDYRSDIFSFGLLLYEMTCGELPFKTIQPEFTYEIIKALPTSLKLFRSDIPDAFEHIVWKALAREPLKVYRRTDELVTDLRSLRAGLIPQGFEGLQIDGAKSAPQSDPLIRKTLAGHYSVLEKIGSGAMGVVYRARDNRLSRNVALKVLPTGMLANDLARQQFHREARALSQLNHPNIATIHEFDTEAGMDFLVMEYVPGTTLAQKLAKHTLAEEEVASLGAQIVLALESAHEQGLIHRDLKPGNIMVTPKGHVKVLDFGLAKLVEPMNVSATTLSLAEPEGVVGTLPYMSPEQLRGDKVDVRSDLYSVGAVLYEMATSRRPFPETHGPRLIDAILHRLPPSPSAVNSSVSVPLEKIILKALEKEPQRRYQSDKELWTDLDRLRVPALASAVPVVLPKHWMLVAAIATILVFLAGFALLWQRSNGVTDQTLRNRSPSPWTIKPRRSVAVLGFKNVSGKNDTAWLSTALSEMLKTELAAGERLRTVSGEEVARAKTELALGETDSFAKDTLLRIRDYLDTDLVICGSYVVLGEKVRLDLRLQDAGSGETVESLSETATATDAKELSYLVSWTGARLKQKLGIEKLTPPEEDQLRRSQPSSLEATRLYAEGLDKLRLFDALAARDRLERALAEDPSNALARSALATTFSALGYGERAKQEARKAVELSASLSREERLLVQGRSWEAARDWQKEVEVYRTLFGFFPDNLEYGLQLASAQISHGKGREALATIDVLKKLPPPAGNHPRIDLAEARAAEALSDFAREQAAAARAADKAIAQGARLVVAGARLWEGQALRSLGHLERARSALEEARRIYSTAGDFWGTANAITNLAVVLRDLGDASGAKTMAQESLATYRKIGDKKGVAAALTNLASMARSQGQLTEAKKMYGEALPIFREISDRSNQATTLNNIANLLALQGELLQAEEVYEQALTIFREIENKNAVATVLGNIADLQAERGNLASAKNLYSESVRTFRQIGNRSFLAHKLSGLGDILATEGDLTEARRSHEEALLIRKELAEKGGIAESQLALAQISIEEGDPKAAGELVRMALEEFQKQKRVDDEMSAHAVLAQSLLAQKEPARAQETIERALALSGHSSKLSSRFAVAITAASIDAALGRSAKASRSLKKILAEAARAGLVSTQLEARLTLGEIEITSNNAAAGFAQLLAVEKEATAKGYGLIARKASTKRGVLTPSRV